jgi:hypothetical protein
MSKTHLTLTKESAVAITVLASLILMAILNVILLMPGIVGLLIPQKGLTNQSPIDREVVKQAIKSIEP